MLESPPTRERFFKAQCKTSFLRQIEHNSPTVDLTLCSSNLHGALVRIHASASSPSASSIRVPPELIQYVDGGRNPDIYTREFVELARRGNQLMKGKQEAFGSFRDILAREMASALPEVRSDVENVVTETGGDVACLNAGGV